MSTENSQAIQDEHDNFRQYAEEIRVRGERKKPSPPRRKGPIDIDSLMEEFIADVEEEELAERLGQTDDGDRRLHDEHEVNTFTGEPPTSARKLQR